MLGALQTVGGRITTRNSQGRKELGRDNPNWGMLLSTPHAEKSRTKEQKRSPTVGQEQRATGPIEMGKSKKKMQIQDEVEAEVEGTNRAER